MGRQPSLTKEIKTEIVERYLHGEGAIQLGQIYGFHPKSLREWVKKYQENGIIGLVHPNTLLVGIQIHAQRIINLPFKVILRNKLKREGIVGIPPPV